MSRAAETPERSGEEAIFGHLFAEVRTALDLSKRLMGRYEASGLNGLERREAGQAARSIAVAGRIGFSSLSKMNQRAPELFERYAIALRVATRLNYCLLALACDDPEPLALISSNELEAILSVESDGDARFEELVAMVPIHRDRVGEAP